jgi:hypothetical protein
LWDGLDGGADSPRVSSIITNAEPDVNERGEKTDISAPEADPAKKLAGNFQNPLDLNEVF